MCSFLLHVGDLAALDFVVIAQVGEVKKESLADVVPFTAQPVVPVVAIGSAEQCFQRLNAALVVYPRGQDSDRTKAEGESNCQASKPSKQDEQSARVHRHASAMSIHAGGRLRMV